MDSKTKKSQFGIRIPLELNKLLEDRVKKIGISKSAYILTLIYNALEKSEQTNETDKEK